MDVLQKPIREMNNPRIDEQALAIAKSSHSFSGDGAEEITLAGTLSRSDPVPPRWYDIIDRRNLLSVAARVLRARIADPATYRGSIGPTPVKDMWPRWYEFHQRRVEATRLREKLEKRLLEEAGGLPVATLRNVGMEGVVEVRSFAEINRMASQLDAQHLTEARAELRRGRRRWKEADRRLGYSAAVALEQKLTEQAGISGRVMWLTRPSSPTEVAAKLHCLIVMNDPRLEFETAPWPELRMVLKDLVRIADK